MDAKISIWTGADTSEAGPSVDDERATVEVEASGGTIQIHLASHVLGDLWTVAADLDPQTARLVAASLSGLADAVERAEAKRRCPTCQRGGMMPPHFASPRCESGGHNHCSCDTCF